MDFCGKDEYKTIYNYKDNILMINMSLRESIDMCLVALLMGDMSIELTRQNILMYTRLEIDKCTSINEVKELLK